MDNLPTVVMEAMAAGLPVVSTPIGGVAEMVDNGVTGFLVPPNQSMELADKLASVIENRELARSLGQAGRRRASELFDIRKNVAELSALFQKFAL